MIMLWEKGNDEGFPQLSSFHVNHRNLRSTMQGISRGLIKRRVSQGRSLSRLYFSETG
jgi:hypothetical protein